MNRIKAKHTKPGLILMVLFLGLISIRAQKVYNVLDYGALGDGISENAPSIQKAIDEAAASGGGIVLLPEGTYRTTTIYLKDNVTLRLANAKIMGSPDYDAYPVNAALYETYMLSKYYPTRCLISGRGVKNIAIEGTGVIDGNGMHENLLVSGNDRSKGIDLVKFQKCENVRIEGTSGKPYEKLLITNSAHWALFPVGVDGLIIKNVKVSNFGGPMPDGLPISDSRNVLVENVLVESDDDALTLKSGRPDGLGIMKNITVRNSVFRSRVCGFKIGPQTWGGYENIHISGCHFEGIGIPPGTLFAPNNGIVIQSSSGGYINGVLIEDCTIAKEPSPIAVYVCRTLGRYTYWSEDRPADLKFGTIEDVTFRNIRAYDVGTFGIMIEGREESIIKNIEFDGLYVSNPGRGTQMEIQEEQPETYPNIVYIFDELHTWGMHLRHVDGIRFKDVYMWTEEHDPRKDIYTHNVKNFDKGSYKPQVRKPAGISTDPGQTRHWKADSTSSFEVGTQIRAWTIHDEGMTSILDNMQSMAGINNLYMVVVMHQEHRPFQAPEFPHNPARDTFQAEDSRVTFFPDMDRYGEVKPLLSDFKWIRETDWLQLMVDSCRARGLAVGAEVSHYPIPKSLIRERPDWQQKKIDGTSANSTRFCPNSPEPRAYVIALFGDLAENYDLDYLQTCQHLFWHEDIDEGGTCFCRHCIAEAKKTGFDLKVAMKVLVKDKNAQPEWDQWREFRAYSTKKFYKDISDEIQRVKKNPKCHLRYNDTYPYRRWDPRDLSMNIDEVSEHLGSLVNQDHEEQKGNSDETFEIRKKWLSTNRQNIGPDKPLICGIAPRIKATPELVKTGIKVALEHPANVNGLALKHYDGASYGLLRAFKQGMIEAGVEGLTPTLGKEFEDMELKGFSRIDDYVEEWGVETRGKGKASYSFDLDSGSYDVRITYFDEEKGHSKLTLFIAGKEKAGFRLDEDTDCWRSRLFPGISVNSGDQITVMAESDQGETVRLDYLEFIPVNVK